MRKLLKFIDRYATPILVVTAVFASTGAAFAGNGPNTNFPFIDTFENYTNGTPLINGTNGWYGSSYRINRTNWVSIVQTNKVRTGIKAAMIPVDCILSNRFQRSAPTNVWIQMDVRPCLFNGMNNPEVDTSQAGVFFVNSNGNFVVHNGVAYPDPTNSVNWVTLTNGGIGPNGTNWVRIGIYADFSKTNWDLFADGVLVTNRIGFVNTSLTNFAGFEAYNGLNT